MHDRIRQEPGRPAAVHRDAGRAAPVGTGLRPGAGAPAAAVRPLGRAALHVAGLGWPVFPVRPHVKVPAITGWEDVATTDPDQIIEWWATRGWNIGLPAGRAGLLVVDLDRVGLGRPPGHLAGPADGAEVLGRLAAAAGEPIPATYTVLSPSGGRHLYFHQPDGVELRNTQGALGPLIDTRGHGGYVLATGSRLPGGIYRELRRPVAPLPGWLAAALTPRPEADAPPTTPRDVDELSGWRAPAYLRAVVEGERRNVAAAPVGQRHRTLLRAARRLGQWVGGGALTSGEARAVLTDAAHHFLGVDGYTARQIDRDITDGLAYGAHRPRHRIPHRIAPDE